MRAWISTALVTAVSLVLAPAALADSSNSSNWAGYAVHRGGVNFRRVTASWREPTAACTAGRQTYSAFWVGIGGYNANSQALEQIGTEADCNGSGNAVLSAWYELVPAPSSTIRFTLAAGDRIDANVTVSGHQVTLSLYDATSHHGFTRTLHASTVDTSSAEWIVEAPSECVGTYSCQTLPLADFGTATFNSARVQSAKGHQGGISDPAWTATKIKLTPGGHRFATTQSVGPSTGAASPSGLLAGGSSFKVNYSTVSLGGNPFAEVRSAAALSDRHLVHPVR